MTLWEGFRIVAAGARGVLAAGQNVSCLVVASETHPRTWDGRTGCPCGFPGPQGQKRLVVPGCVAPSSEEAPFPRCLGQRKGKTSAGSSLDRAAAGSPAAASSRGFQGPFLTRRTQV